MFFAYAFLAWLFPYTGDDWSWGSSIGMDRLNIFFADYNGRYAGNLLVLVLTRCKLLDAAVMAAAFSSVCYASYAYAKDQSNAALLLAAFLYLLMPKEMWAQAAVWTAGFTNYVPSALISAAFLISVREITDSELSDRKDTLKHGIGWCVLGFVGALFVESVTVFHICLAVAVIAWTFLRFRKYRFAHLGFFLGSVIGTWIMFSNGAYDRIAQGEDYYRHTPVGLRDTVYFAVDQAGKIMDYILYHNTLFCVIVTALLLLLAIRRIRTGEKRWKILPAVFHVCCLGLLFCKDTVFSVITGRIPMKALFAGCIPVAIAVLYVFSILLMVLCFVEKGRRFRMLLPLYCAVVSLAPLLVVDPIGPRCVFIGYLLMILFAVDLFGYTRKQILPQEKWLGRLIGLAAAAQLLFLVHIFYPIHYYDALRVDYLRAQAAEGKTQVQMCDLPNQEYVWDGTPAGESWINKYRLFYDLPEDLQITVIPYYELEWQE